MKVSFLVIYDSITLKTSTYLWEILFSISLCLSGYILFSLLIGKNGGLSLRDTEEWMRHRQSPEDLCECVRRFMQYKRFAT
ncbi:hypothetical protein ACFX12_023559 [Malus domestica]